MKRRLVLTLLAASALGACTVGPRYERPSTPTPAAYKTLDGWRPAQPADALDRGAWWTLFGDTTLNELESRIVISNQTVAAAEANYRQARAIVREQRSALFPAVDLTGGVTRSGSGGGGGTTTGTTTGGTTIITSGSGERTTYRAGIGATWEPDVWGRIRLSVNAANANAQASAADLAAATLSSQGELATNYLGLRQTDGEIAVVQATVAAYQRSLTITTNRFNAGIAPHSDALQAQSQLATSQATLAGLEQARVTYENAIAVLVGQAAGDFHIAPVADWSAALLATPLEAPSTLLERRPDIASAERRVAAANADIGVARTAYFPSFSLSASGASASTVLGDLFSASANSWSLGLSAAQTLFDAGARKAQVEQARAGYDASVADYRLTALNAFADVENQLTALKVLEQQYALRLIAADAATQTEQMLLNQYNAGQVAYTDVVTAQTTALTARRTLLTAGVARRTATVALIQALGGGWRAEAG